MDLIITPGKLSGNLSVIPSKSQAHRLLICAAFADGPTVLDCPGTNRDIQATAACLNALGADIRRTETGYDITPVREPAKKALLPCRDSGSTLRFLLPVVGALGVDAFFQMEGRLAQRPLSPLWEEMERMGCNLSFSDANTLHCSGQLRSGEYRIDGSVSSQFISGLLFAAALLPGESKITVTGKTESRPYIEMTQNAMEIFGRSSRDLTVTGGMPFQSPKSCTVEGDWSNGAFFLAANALGSDIAIGNLSEASFQGDRAAAMLLAALKQHRVIPAADIPDLVPILSVAAACSQGAVFTNIQRLRLKESDRVASVIAMVRGLGGKAAATEDTLTVFGTGLTGGTVNCVNDHRIAMSAAIAATACREHVILLGAECVEKSYPLFWEEYRRLGGNYEQYIR